MKKVILLMLSLGGFSCIAAPLPPADLLAKNEVIAEYVGVKDLPCNFRTSLCPDQCGHAKTVARFAVLDGINYERSGEYGDAQIGRGEVIYVDIKNDIEGQDADIIQEIKSLKVGQKVRLEKSHYYVNKDGSRYPVRLVTSFSIEK